MGVLQNAIHVLRKKATHCQQDNDQAGASYDQLSITTLAAAGTIESLCTVRDVGPPLLDMH